MKEKEKNGSPGAVVLTEGKPWQCILRFALPLFLGSLLQQLYYAADALMVGRLIGQRALSGVGTCGVLVNLLIALSVGFSTGAGVISARCFGAGKRERIRAGLGQAVAISLLITLVLSAAAFACAPWLAEAFGIQGDSAWYCARHIRWISFPLLFFALYFPCLGLYQGAGKGMVSTSLSASYLAVCLLLAYGLRGAVGYRALFLCKPVSWALIAGVNYLYYFKGSWQKALGKERQPVGHSAQK